MAIYSGGKSTAINSPRHLTIRHARRLVAARQGAGEIPGPAEMGALKVTDVSRGILPPLKPMPMMSMAAAAADTAAAAGIPVAVEEEPDKIDLVELKPGEEKLNSFWAPGLAAGRKHRVKVRQLIDAKNRAAEKLRLTAEQTFFVDAPQFSLPDGSVHSVYPPPGYPDDRRILPHVVLTDPHLPWERLGSPRTTGEDNPDKRNRTPWLVLVSFAQDELRLTPEELVDPEKGLFRGTSEGVIKPVKQSPTMTVNMSIADLMEVKSKGVTTPVVLDPDRPDMTDLRGDFVFVKPSLFTGLFSEYDNQGKRKPASSPVTMPYRFLSHVRKINPEGMALAGVEDTAIFSIVIGSRAGPLDNLTPTTMSAHLLSIESVEDMQLPIPSSAKYVAMCSLHSWNYTVQPPGMRNVREGFTDLGRTLDVLRVPERIARPLIEKGDDVSRRIALRMKDGYTMLRYRMQTGETTAALFRGPFTPTVVPPLQQLNRCSNSGVDLQILDKEVGLMDISYSVAWQVGRTLALGDEAFTAALVRLRTAIQGPAMNDAKYEVIKAIDGNSILSRREVLKDLPGMVSNLAAVHLGDSAPSHTPAPVPAPPGDGDEGGEEGGHGGGHEGDGDGPIFAPGGPKKRWFRHRLTRREIPSLSFTASAIEEKYPATSLKAARALASSTDGAVFDETNLPTSTDWMLVLSWLVDRMFLAGVPAHYLIADPSHLEPESLRFFYIDPNWVDALLDGALSLGNHMGHDQDRVAIKQAINDYVELGRQIPTYGFYLRSDLVTMFPDLRVTTLPERPEAAPGVVDKAPLLRHEIVADGVMIGLLDRVPGSDEFTSLVFTQPPHQQRFAAAFRLDAAGMGVDIRRQYTVDQATRETDPNRHDALVTQVLTPDKNDGVFMWHSDPDGPGPAGKNDLRVMGLQKFAQWQRDVLAEKMPRFSDPVTGESKPYFEDDVPTSALFAMQLNDPKYNLTINFRAPETLRALASLAAPRDGAPPMEEHPLRTLVRLLPPVVDKPRDDDDDDSDDETESGDASWDGDSDDETVVYDRPDEYKPQPHLLASLGPHVNIVPEEKLSEDPKAKAVPAASAPASAPAPAPAPASAARASAARASAPAPASSSSSHPPSLRGLAAPAAAVATASAAPARPVSSLTSDPASAPVYDIAISSRGSAGTVITLHQQYNLAQDLTFSIRVAGNVSSQYKLVEFSIRIELGPVAKTKQDPNYLTERYVGPGCSMLSNLRFNVLLSNPTIKGTKYLQVRFLPRSSKGWIEVGTVKDMSCLLSLVQVNDLAPGGIGRRTGQFLVKSWADYCKDPTNPSIEKENIVTVENRDTLVTVVDPGAVAA